MYRGYKFTMIGIIPYAGINFGVYETLKFHSKKFNQNEEFLFTNKMICGAIAGAIGQTVTYPIDVLRRRVQTYGFADGVEPLKSNTMIGALSHIIKYEGVKALFKGLSINYMKVTLVVSLCFTFYDTINERINKKKV